MRSLIALLTVSYSVSGFAWGERGHHLICEVATRLVQEKGLVSFMQRRGDMMGHVCNIPDIQWKSLGPIAKSGDAAHFMDPEHLDFAIANVPVSFAAIVKDSGKSGPEVADLLGSLWWRTDQFARRAQTFARSAKAARPPKGSAEEQDNEQPYNLAVYNMTVSMGLMGHFVGDASMPYHNTSDYDGWAKGRGGIHAYYETYAVNSMDLTLVNDVMVDAKRQRADKVFPPANGTTVERMRALSTLSVADMPLVDAADEIYAPSESGPPKVFAKRPSDEAGAAAFRKIIVPQMARSALLLAAFWDDAYRAGGSPALGAYKSYRYPLFTEFVPLDYVGAPNAEGEEEGNVRVLRSCTH